MWNYFSSVPTKSYNNINILSFPVVSLQKDYMMISTALTLIPRLVWSTGDQLEWPECKHSTIFFFLHNRVTLWISLYMVTVPIRASIRLSGGNGRHHWCNRGMRNHINVIPAPLKVTKSFSEAPHSVCMSSVPLALPASTTLSCRWSPTDVEASPSRPHYLFMSRHTIY